MKPRVHSSLLLLVTLIIGMVLGALIQGSIRSQRIKGVRIMTSEESFVMALKEAIHPVDDAQSIAVLQILEAYAPLIITNVEESRAKVRAELEAMQDKLAPLLSEEQKQNLQERLARPHHHGGKKPENKS